MGSPGEPTESPRPEDDARIGDTERAVLGVSSVAEIRAMFGAYTEDRLGSPIADVRFRSGRIDVVWGVALGDGREIVIKAHRLPADMFAIGAATDANGNTAVAAGELVGTFDWELVADTAAVIAGFTAAAYASSSSSGGGLSTPDEVADFLRDYEVARDRPLSGDEQRAAAGAAAWIVSFNARWELGMGGSGTQDGTALSLVRHH